MQQSSLRSLGLAALVTLLQACGDPESSTTSGPDGGAVPTNSMTMNLTVESSEPGSAVVHENLNDGRVLATSYRLDGGDMLRACLNGLCRTMTDEDLIFTLDYVARFDYQPGVDYIVSFNRQRAQSAPDSRVTLPPTFTIVTPANNQQVAAGETVIVSWSPAGAPALASLIYNADCSQLSGSHVLSAGTLSTDMNADGRESVRIDAILDNVRRDATSTITRCNIDVIVRHELQGRVDPAFRNGTAVGVVSRKVSLDYIAR